MIEYWLDGGQKTSSTTPKVQFGEKGMMAKVRYICALLLVGLLVSTLLTPIKAQAASEPLEWTSVDKPGEYSSFVVSPSEVTEIAVGRDGVIYAVDSANSKVYRSSNSGETWEDITDNLADRGAELPASKIAVAPDTPDIVAVVTDQGTRVYLSTDGGMDWTDTYAPTLQSTIQAIAISNEYTEGEKEFREIAIGTADWEGGTTGGQVWVQQIGKSWASWEDQELTIELGSQGGGKVSALAYSPDYGEDKTIIVVAADHQNQTWLCLLKRDTGVWNSPAGYPVPIASAVGTPEVSHVYSSLALPSDYSNSEEAPARQLFVSYNREPDADNVDDVYWVDDTYCYRLYAGGTNAINISSIAYYGTLASGTLLAGEADPIDGTKTVQVWRTMLTNNFAPSSTRPTWHPSTVPPTGPGNARLGWSSDGKIAYCGTGQIPGVRLDESAFSASSDDGDNWQQLGLVDTRIGMMLSDITVAPDSKTLFAATFSESDPEGIWRTTSTGLGLGEYWSRQLTMDTTSDRIIIRLSPNYASDSTVYVAKEGGHQIAVSHTRGNSWEWSRDPGEVVDMVVEDRDTVYIALADGRLKKSTNGARTWLGSVDTELPDINMLAMAEEETILVGGRNGDVAYSTDEGESFTRIPEIVGGGNGDVQVVADANYHENHTIYAATNKPDEGIWRWTIGVSTRWEQIDEAITELGKGQCISGLAVGPEGTLYALRLEPANHRGGGMTRSLNPLEPDASEVEFDLVNNGLPGGAAFDPTAVFPNTIPYLKLSGDAEQNDLWTINTANQMIYHFQDTMCKSGPTLVTPEAGGILRIDASGDITNLTLEWEEMEGAEGYEAVIYQDPDAIQGVWSETTKGITLNVTEVSDLAQLTSGTTYYWRVRAVEPVKSPWSELRSLAPGFGGGQWSPLSTSAGSSPITGATNVPIRPAFTWNPADGAVGYEFVLARDSKFTDVVVAMTGENALPWTAWGCDRDLGYATTYFWKVRAISATSYSEWGTGIFTTVSKPVAESPPVVVQPASPPTPVIPTPSPESTTESPSHMLWWVAIGIGVALVVALLVRIVRRGR